MKQFKSGKECFIDLNQIEVGAPLEPKLIQQLMHLRDTSKTIEIEEEEVKSG